MSRTYISETLRKRVAESARHRCGYCHTQGEIVGYTLHIEHIIPRATGGLTTEENLWLACSVSNNYKGAQVEAEDPVTKTFSPIFNPRSQYWLDHFVWSEDGEQIIGLTPIGRATVLALQLNAPVRINARRRWASAGWHPPLD